MAADKRVWWYIKNYQTRNGWAPTVREIAKAFECAVSTAHAALRRLEAQDWLVLGHGPRMIRLLSPTLSTLLADTGSSSVKGRTPNGRAATTQSRVSEKQSSQSAGAANAIGSRRG